LHFNIFYQVQGCTCKRIKKTITRIDQLFSIISTDQSERLNYDFIALYIKLDFLYIINLVVMQRKARNGLYFAFGVLLPVLNKDKTQQPKNQHTSSPFIDVMLDIWCIWASMEIEWIYWKPNKYFYKLLIQIQKKI
jgi:hypothetical protein